MDTHFLTAARPAGSRFFSVGAGVPAIFAALLPACVALLLLAACERRGAEGAGSKEAGGSGRPPTAARLHVVATTAMIADAARNIGGERVEVVALMGEGVDPHLYKATPADLRELEKADVVLYNGLHLEGRLGDVLEQFGKRKPVVGIGEKIDPALLRRPSEFQGHPDPHIWFDVSLWSTACASARDALIARDPAGKADYESAAKGYLLQLDELHRWCKEELSHIPAERRLLVTAHDAFGYFGRAYGLEVRGIQGISTDSEASIRDINALVDTLVERKVPAVFVESSVPRKTIDALVEGCRSRGHEIRVGGQLYSDAMGAAGTPEGTYIGMVRANVRTIAHALGGTDKKPTPSAPVDDQHSKKGEHATP